MNNKNVRKAAPIAPIAPTKATAKSSKSVAPARKTTAAAHPSAAPVAAAPKPKNRLVRDSFTIPKAEYIVLEALKVRAAKLARPVKKSELLRAGIGALNGMSDKAFLAAMNGVPSLKTGRPSGAEKAAVSAKSAK